jgi:hypothetical protein
MIVSVLKITFLEPAQVDDTIYFEYYPYAPGDLVTLFGRGFDFKTNRFFYGHCAIGVDSIAQAQNFVDAFNADYNDENYFIVSRELNVVSIALVNGNPIVNPEINPGATFASFEIIESSIDNMIHEIIFTPRQYAVPSFLSRNYLITEDDLFIITEDNKKIRL